MFDLTTHPTPNPDSIKFTANGRAFIESGMESFSEAEEARGHPLGERLFSLQGIQNVFVMPQFVTVTKQPAADWDFLLPMIEETLSAYFEEVGEAG